MRPSDSQERLQGGFEKPRGSHHGICVIVLDRRYSRALAHGGFPPSAGAAASRCVCVLSAAGASLNLPQAGRCFVYLGGTVIRAHSRGGLYAYFERDLAATCPNPHYMD